ncbi:hypothetical protein [Allokutzneria multivorans]|uniref:hypothetical protein n=1 Tax=Allokutzneria multivorans TaxID=1142134 RepID=UPI0031ED2BC5
MAKSSAAVLALALLALTGCTSTVAGEPAAPEGVSAGIPETPAMWASTQIDPCKLLAAQPGTAFSVKPHSCAVEADGAKSRIVARVGTAFDHSWRKRSAPVTVGGLTAYQRIDASKSTFDDTSCKVDIPLSATVSVQLEARASDAAVESGCASARAAATSAAGLLAKPEGLTRVMQNTLGHWDLCDLLTSALGEQASREEPALNRDSCKTEGISSSQVSLEATTGTDPVSDARANPQGATFVQLQGTEATQLISGLTCVLEWTQERSPVERPGYEVQRMRLAAEQCPRSVEAANKIRLKLAGKAPAPPARPAKLGFPEGTPDESSDRACQVLTYVEPGDCRAAKGIAAPKGIEANMTAARGAESSDVACALLGPALREVTGQEPVLASKGKSCVGRPKDFTLDVQLVVDADSSLNEACTMGLARQTVSLSGKPSVSCGPSESSLMLTAGVRGSAEAKGTVGVYGTLDAPRGISAEQPKDAERLKAVERIAELVITRHFTS